MRLSELFEFRFIQIHSLCQNAALRDVMHHHTCPTIREFYFILVRSRYRPTQIQQHIRELVRQSSMHVMNSGGVVRRINSWGTRTLPQRMKRHGTLQSIGECVIPIITCFIPD